MTRYNIRMLSSWPAENDLCGIAQFGRHWCNGLRGYTAERGNIDIAAITRLGLVYHYPPVDIEINKDDPRSWEHGKDEILRVADQYSDPTAFIINHDYGLFKDRKGGDTQGRRVVDYARDFRKKGLTFAQLHTILSKPSEEGPAVHQERVEIIQGLAENCDQLIVLTQAGLKILTSKPYNISREKITIMPHGIRVRDAWQMDRKAMKELYALENTWLAVTLGLKSPGKGIHIGVEGWGKFVTEHLTENSRRDAVYLIAGQWHPNFSRENPQGVNREEEKIAHSAKKYDLQTIVVRNDDELKKVNKGKTDVIFYNTQLDENTFTNFNCAANVIVINNRNKQQITSGILADAKGSGRAIITTKFPHALDEIVPNCEYKNGLMVDQSSGGVAIDPDDPNQVADALLYIASDDVRRYKMEDRNAISARNSDWDIVGGQYITMIQSHGVKRERKKGRGVTLEIRPR